MDSSLRTLLNGDAPVWLSLLDQNADSTNPLTQMKQGLNWAQTLGDAAKNGFKVIYTPINKQNWYEPSMTYYTTLLHKRIIGQTVFDTKIFNGNRFDAHFYAHCTKNMSGSFTLFGVNAADSGLDVAARLPFRSGTEYVEFILTVGVNGKVYLNGAEIIEPTVLTPQSRYKLPGKGAFLSMPAHSVAFWVFIGASIPECASVETIPFEVERPEQRTSSETLLQQLILETVSKRENNADTNAIMNEDVSANRIRRDAANNIDKHDEYNAIEMNKANSDGQTRNKRFIADGKLINKIYNDLDDLKRANLLAVHRQKLGLPTKRMKRDINMLKNLFEKFELQKPVFNLKTPPLKLGAKSFIPAITTVHDVLKPGADHEKDVFKPVDNPELPSGDVHFELAETMPQQNEYAAALAAGNQGVDQFAAQATPLNLAPGPSQYGNIASVPTVAAVQPTFNTAVPSTVLLGELTELDVKSDLVTMAPASAPAVTPAPSVQHQLQLVVKDLPPTWQVNLQNMQKARKNLRQNLWPMATNAQNANPQISALLPNAVHPAQTIKLPREDDHVFFESKRRRRRSIDSKMDGNIENHLQKTLATSKQHTDIDEVELLDQMIRLVDNLERKNSQANQSGGEIRKMLANRRIEITANDTPKKCKVLSLAMEKQCLQTENREKSIFKRATENKRKKSTGPVKKLFAKIKDSVEKPFQFRHRRSIHISTEQINSEENAINAIPKELNEETEHAPRKNVSNRKRNYLISSTSTTSATSTISATSTTSTTSSTSTTKPSTNTEQENGKMAGGQVPKFLRNMKGCINNITNSVVRQVGRWWIAFS